MPQNLKKSKTGIYTYRKVLPPDVRHVFDNKSEIKRSLGDNREQAMLAYHRIEAEIGQKIESARQEARKANHFEAHEQKPRSERALVPIKGDTHNLGPSIAKWQIESLMDQLRARRAGEFDEDEFEDVEQQLIEWPPLIKKAIATGKVMHWSPQISNWLMIKGYFLDATVEQVQTLTYDYLRFLKKCYEVLAKWQQGEDAEIEWPLPPGPFLRAAWEPKEVFVAPLSSQPRASKLSGAGLSSEPIPKNSDHRSYPTSPRNGRVPSRRSDRDADDAAPFLELCEVASRGLGQAHERT